MGTHVSGPSKVDDGSNQYLHERLKEKTEEGGEIMKKEFEGVEGLPFLFKILSIRKALSIQAHPDKKLAEELHSKRPDWYKDDNHKPELAMALTQMEALCGFRPISQIQFFLQRVHELRNVVGDHISSAFLNLKEGQEEVEKKTALKQLFGSIMRRDPQYVEEQISSLIQRLKNRAEDDKEKKVYDLAIRLNDQFPNDVGILSIFLLNYIVLQPGQAIFLAANEPHAYLSGDCAECMACSDNVVRAGLTPKNKDVETLCSMLTYHAGPIEILEGEQINSFTRIYRPPIKEFLLHHIQLDKGTADLQVCNTPSILLTYKGDGSLSSEGHNDLKCHKGGVIFVAPGLQTKLKTEEGISILRCSCNC
eukprot:TRINITY_DN2980_c0_g2_i5.p1 TRINITY_DN2980_c0_g2~~TRINITY_DN2980_c0_g2_i5.p1  ORF type:complete len:364 (-),score=89.08 TRINITY_DN2980_c0_g2_i5:50-1141(-)